MRITTKGKKKGNQNTTEAHSKQAAEVGGTSSLERYLAALSAVSFLLSSTAVSLRLLPPPPFPFPWAPPTADAWRFLLKSASSLRHFHEPLDCFEDPPGPLARLLCCSGPHRGLKTPNTNLECSVDPFVALNTLSVRSSTRHLCQVFHCPPGLRPSPPAIVHHTGQSRLVLPRHGPRKEEPPFSNGCFDALAWGTSQQ